MPPPRRCFVVVLFFSCIFFFQLYLSLPLPSLRLFLLCRIMVRKYQNIQYILAKSHCTNYSLESTEYQCKDLSGIRIWKSTQHKHLFFLETEILNFSKNFRLQYLKMLVLLDSPLHYSLLRMQWNNQHFLLQPPKHLFNW